MNSKFLSLLSICLYFPPSSVIHFFFHFNYFKLGPLGGSRGNSESDQWGASPSRSHQPVLKVRTTELHRMCVCGSSPYTTCTQRISSSLSLPFVYVLMVNMSDILKLLHACPSGGQNQLLLLSVGVSEICQ